MLNKTLEVSPLPKTIFIHTLKSAGRRRVEMLEHHKDNPIDTLRTTLSARILQLGYLPHKLVKTLALKDHTINRAYANTSYKRISIKRLVFPRTQDAIIVFLRQTEEVIRQITA